MTNYLTLGPWRMSWRVLLIGLLVMAGMIAAGRWQTHRAQGKIALQNNLLAAEHAVAIPLDAAPAEPLDLLWHRVALKGTWVPGGLVYLDNRPLGDRVGFYVLMPLRTASGTLVLVNRGWLPRDLADRTRIAPYETPTGEVDVLGVAMPNEPAFLNLGHAQQKAGGIWENLTFDDYRAATGLAVLPIIVREDNAVMDGLTRSWPDRGSELEDQIQRHWGYMVQWYAMAAAVFLLLVYYGLKRGRGARLP